MTPSPEELLNLPEGKTLEFKRDLSSPKPIMKTLVAFANSAGGKVLVGIADDGKLVGVENPQWGSGVRRIVSEAEAQGLPELEIVEIGMRLRVVVPLEGLLETGAQSEPRLESKLAAKLIGSLAEQERGKAELAKFLGNKTVSGELHKQIRNLLDAGYIEMTLPQKPQSRLQKYRLMEKGRQLLKAPKS